MKTIELNDFEIMHTRHALEHYIKEIGRDETMSVGLKQTYYKELVTILDKVVKLEN